MKKIILNIRIILSLFFLLLFTSFATVADSGKPDTCKDYVSSGNQDSNDNRPVSKILYGQGLLWKISGKDGKFAYLFGTMHSQDRLVTSMPPPVRLAIASSAQFAIEVLLEEDSYRVYADASKLPDTQNLQKMLAPDIWSRLVPIADYYRVDAAALNTMKPWAVFTLIGRPRQVRAQTQDGALINYAQSMNKSMVGLEKMEDIVSALDGIPKPDQITILNDTVCNHKEILAQAKELRDFYIARDLAAIVHMNDEPHQDEAVFERYMNSMVYERNRKILEKIIPMIQTSGTFIAIGASHLPDEKGLLNLLAQRGYGVTAVF